MKKLKFTKLNPAEMETIKGMGRWIVGGRVYGGVCYIDVYVSDGNYYLCDQEAEMALCEAMLKEK